MPVRPFTRQQPWLFPPTLDEMIPDDHAVRFVAAFVDNLGEEEWHKLEINLQGEAKGAPNFDCRILLGVWLYGFMTGERSTRRLEKACRDEIPYLWLTGWQHPDHNTFWRFYTEHRDEMRHLFKKTVKTAVTMNLIDLAVQAIDGTKVAANASLDRTYDAAGLKKLLKRLDRVIDEMEKQMLADNAPPPVRLPESLRKAEQLKEQVKVAMQSLAKNKEQQRINLTDNEANLMKSRQGIVPAYNVEAVASPAVIGEGEEKERGMIITAIDAVKDAADNNQMVPMLDQARENTGKKANYSLIDAGFYSGINLADSAKREMTVVMPDPQERILQNPYHKDNFSYDRITDTCICPEGKHLRFSFMEVKNKFSVMVFRSSGAVCRKCKAFGICTKSEKYGREIRIGPFDKYLKKHRKWMATEEAKAIYSYRKELIEPVFGIIKEQMGFRRFLLRGWQNVRAEAVMIATAFNLRTLYRAWRWRLTRNEAVSPANIEKTNHNISFWGLFLSPHIRVPVYV